MKNWPFLIVTNWATLIVTNWATFATPPRSGKVRWAHELCLKILCFPSYVVPISVRALLPNNLVQYTRRIVLCTSPSKGYAVWGFMLSFWGDCGVFRHPPCHSHGCLTNSKKLTPQLMEETARIRHLEKTKKAPTSVAHERGPLASPTSVAH